MGSELGVEAQAGHLRNRYPGATCDVVGGEVRWRGRLRPTPLSDEYLVSITYRRDDAPRCMVLEPPLESRGDSRPPHTYPPDERLCLYRPGRGEWDATRPIATTIVPWALEWLANYELWLATGDWLGGGEHPGDEVPQPNRAARRRRAHVARHERADSKVGSRGG